LFVYTNTMCFNCRRRGSYPREGSHQKGSAGCLHQHPSQGLSVLLLTQLRVLASLSLAGTSTNADRTTSGDVIMGDHVAYRLLSSATTGCACASFLCLFISVTTDHWLYTSERKHEANGSIPAVYDHYYSGLWKKCVGQRESNTCFFPE